MLGTCRPKRAGATWARRVTPPTEPTLGDQVQALRALEGAARRRAESTFMLRACGFVMRCCSWFFGDDLDRDDVIAEAQAALWQAVLDWQPDGGAPFDTFARWRLRTALRGLLRRSRLVRSFGSECFVGLDDEEAAS